MQTRHLVIPLFLLLSLLLAGSLPAQTGSPVPVWPGIQPDGSVLLPNQWSLRPAGTQVQVGDFPVNIAVHPAGRFAAVLHAGYGTHEIQILDIVSGSVISRTSVNQAFYGLRFSSDGSRLFASGAGDEVVHSFTFKAGYLYDHREIRVRPVASTGVVAGLDLDKKARNLWLVNLLGHTVSRVSTDDQAKVFDFSLGQSPGSTKPPSAGNGEDVFPYTCLLDPEGERLYVSLWGKSRVEAVDPKTGRALAQWKTDEHPNEMVLSSDGRRLFVANANRNTVTVIDVKADRILETLYAALYPSSPPGSTPNSLALTPDDQLLFVANACNNDLAVFDVSDPGHARSLGFIPTGWYPTSVRVTPDGRYLLVANGKGVLPKANRNGPQPQPSGVPASLREYIAGLLIGTVSIIRIPEREVFLAELRDYTKAAFECSPFKEGAEVVTAPAPGNPIPAAPGGPSPIKHCIYIIKENRTYDQVFGDMPAGNGDPALCLFPEEVTPNHHELARQFVLLDNFYVESEVSADGHEWSLGAYASDFVEKTWPLNYGHNEHDKFPYPSEGTVPVAFPAEGYLWDRAKEAGVDYRSYGEFINNGRTPDDPGWTKIEALQGHFDPLFRGWDLDYPDVKRAERFIAELKRFEQEGKMPQLQILRLPNDHTSGTSAGKLSPRSMVADNDLALGMVVEAVSRSRFWPETAIFVVEDDAQNGPDHVDAHRTVAFVISPYTRSGKVDSSLYSTSSMLRTIELIFGLRPMSQFDAAARPMYNSFETSPKLAPYPALPARIRMDERNSQRAWGAKLSARMDFSKEDAADDLLLNEVIWRSIRGADQPMPAPVRAGFVFVHPEEAEDDDN